MADNQPPPRETPLLEVPDSFIEQNSNSFLECAICNEPITDPSLFITEQQEGEGHCFHTFHYGRYCSEMKECPICRRKVLQVVRNTALAKVIQEMLQLRKGYMDQMAQKDKRLETLELELQTRRNKLEDKTTQKPEDRRKREAIQEEEREREESQETEFQIISKHDRKSLRIGEFWYLVESEWLHKWVLYSKQLSNFHPGPIPNYKLLDMAGFPRSDLKVSVNYRGLVPYVWNYLHQKYGGGPVIARVSTNIYSNPVLHSEY